jgi:hypothetical protein
MEARRSSETLVTTCKTARCHNPEYDDLYFERRENLRSHKYILIPDLNPFHAESYSEKRYSVRKLLKPQLVSSTLKMELIRSSETLVTTCKTVQREKPEDNNRQGSLNLESSLLQRLECRKAFITVGEISRCGSLLTKILESAKGAYPAMS